VLNIATSYGSQRTLEKKSGAIQRYKIRVLAGLALLAALFGRLL
jgi:hypothetical protein